MIEKASYEEEGKMDEEEFENGVSISEWAEAWTPRDALSIIASESFKAALTPECLSRWLAFEANQHLDMGVRREDLLSSPMCSLLTNAGAAAAGPPAELRQTFGEGHVIIGGLLHQRAPRRWGEDRPVRHRSGQKFPCTKHLTHLRVGFNPICSSQEVVLKLLNLTDCPPNNVAMCS